MPDEIFVLALSAITMGAVTVIAIGRMVTRVIQARHTPQIVGQGSGMAASELKRLIMEAVIEAQMPLEDRVARIEDLLRRQKAPTASVPEPEKTLGKDILSDMDHLESSESVAGRRRQTER